MTKKELQEKLEQSVIELYTEKGKIQKEIAEELGISNKTVVKILKKHGITAKVSAKQLDFLYELILRNFEIKDPIKLRQNLNFLSLKQVRGMIMTFMRYEKLQKQLNSIENNFKYYEKMLDMRKKTN